ncbi:hypothetical protein CC78DRAFT_546738 [Lojkania enalia]|uniref:Uncharacterized protein n=1 Tax=Lojkania enalia TaxID=147567 RepID=A0A9P4K3R4_9PLEO|nr:hypothetical protein CC78DRAFT_546738 [Didymosphaeria enalia]
MSYLDDSASIASPMTVAAPPPTATDVVAISTVMKRQIQSDAPDFMDYLPFVPQMEEKDAAIRKLMVGRLRGVPVYCYCFARRTDRGCRLLAYYWNNKSTSGTEKHERLSIKQLQDNVKLSIPFNYLVEGKRGQYGRLLSAFIKACFVMKGLTAGSPIETSLGYLEALAQALKIVRLKFAGQDAKDALKMDANREADYGAGGELSGSSQVQGCAPNPLPDMSPAMLDGPSINDLRPEVTQCPNTPTRYFTPIMDDQYLDSNDVDGFSQFTCFPNLPGPNPTESRPDPVQHLVEAPKISSVFERNLSKSEQIQSVSQESPTGGLQDFDGVLPPSPTPISTNIVGDVAQRRTSSAGPSVFHSSLSISDIGDFMRDEDAREDSLAITKQSFIKLKQYETIAGLGKIEIQHLENQLRGAKRRVAEAETSGQEEIRKLGKRPKGIPGTHGY